MVKNLVLIKYKFLLLNIHKLTIWIKLKKIIQSFELFNLHSSGSVLVLVLSISTNFCLSIFSWVTYHNISTSNFGVGSINLYLRDGKVSFL